MSDVWLNPEGRATVSHMATPEPSTSPHAFRRQVTFRLGADDAPLLELAARAHGGIQAGIVAALRAYASQRLQPAAEREPEPAVLAAEPAPASEQPKPRQPRSEPDEGTVELNLSEASDILDLTPATLRAGIREGRRPGRVRDNGFYLAEIPVSTLRAGGTELSARGAAEVLGLKPGTIKKRCKAGRYPNAQNDGLGWTIPVEDIL